MEAIRVAADFEGLQIAALELLEEAFDAPERARIEQLAAVAANSEKLLASLPQRRTLSPGYYFWIAAIQEHVIDAMEAGIAFRERDIRSEEWLCVLAIRRARADFSQKHPPCRGCGKPLRDAQANQCDACAHAQWEMEVKARR